MSLKIKELKALELVKRALSNFDNPFISCSFGKDSLVVMHLVHRVNKNVPLVWSKTGVSHPSVNQVRNYYKEQGIKIIEAKPETSFWEIVKKYGWPIGARSTSSNKAVSQCCNRLKKKPMAIVTECFDLEFNGVTAFESWTRYCRLKADGLYKFVKSRGKDGRQVCMPIGFWHVEDVWEYIDKYDIKYPLLYDQEIDGLNKIGYKEKVKGIQMDRGMIRLGCWSCPLTIKYTDKTMKQLRIYYPRMWRMLMEKGLANEIIKLKINEEDMEECHKSNINNWLDKRPCFFDHI